MIQLSNWTLKLLYKASILILFLLFFSSLTAQTIENDFGLEQIQMLKLNQEAMKKNRVRSIQTKFMVKKELSPIVKKPQITSYYEFDNDGNKIMYYKTFLLHDTVYDTLVEFYSYNEKNQLVTKRRSEYGKFGVYDYTYNDNNKVVKMEHYTEENVSQSKLTFIPKNRQLQETELYQIQKIDSLSYIIYTLSADNVRYKEEEAIYENGKLQKSHSRLLFGSQKYDVFHFAYFENDLIKKEVVDNFNSTVKKQYIYGYNEEKEIASIKIYEGKGEKHLYTIEFLYQEKTKLLDAILKKDEATGTIEITKLKYTFY